MATDIREVLSKYVPQSVLDEALEEIKTTEIAPEWYRNDIAKVGAEAKEAQQLRARLASIEKAPKREALAKRFGVDMSSLKRAERHALEQFDWEGDEPSEEAFAQHLSEWEIPTQGQPQGQSSEAPNAAGVVEAAQRFGSTPAPTNQDAEFYRELAAAPTAEAGQQVLAKYGRLATSDS